MTGFFVFLFEHLYRAQSVRRSMGSYILILLAVYTAMMAGVFMWQVYGSIYIFSLAMIADMVLYLWGTLHRGMLSTGPRTYWLANRPWSFGFLVLVFAAEFFMGAAFDVQYYGAVPFIASTGIVPLTGSILAVAGKAVFDFFIFFGSVSLSSWFLVMMGIEMGSLVVFKIRKTRDMETRIRLSLMLVAYGIYSILLPSFIIQNPASVPFIGWSMGIGTAGPVSPLLILPMLLTYVISGILSLLFGSRQLCSVFCTAPVMYQGTFYDSMKKFNTSSGMSKSLTRADRTGNMVYRIVSNMVYVSVIAAAVISWLDSTGRLNLTFYGTDPEYMLYIFYFGFLWYAVFILMPYVGSYGCINTGYCQWGNFNRFISRFGFFRLKVRDPNQCVTCPTKDCASACPVGNYGQPGSFITTGEYKDSRCVGIGDCVNACPYENIFYYDVRHWVKEKISKK
jgi:polyferredoxin